jgi:hypothetical protein
MRAFVLVSAAIMATPGAGSGHQAPAAAPPPGEEQHLFEFQVQAAMLTQTTGHGDPAPRHTIWRAT